MRNKQGKFDTKIFFCYVNIAVFVLYLLLLTGRKASSPFGWYSVIASTHEGMARLSWPGWLITYRDLMSRTGKWTRSRSRSCTADTVRLSVCNTNTVLEIPSLTRGENFRSTMQLNCQLCCSRVSSVDNMGKGRC